jgi:hypothetical protein
MTPQQAAEAALPVLASPPPLSQPPQHHADSSSMERQPEVQPAKHKGKQRPAHKPDNSSYKSSGGLPLPALVLLGVAAAGAAAGLVLLLLRRRQRGAAALAGDGDTLIIDDEDAAFEATIKAMEAEEKAAAGVRCWRGWTGGGG